MNWVSTVRGRLGIAMDRWLIYTGPAAQHSAMVNFVISLGDYL
jgi:hypothetical protein